MCYNDNIHAPKEGGDMSSNPRSRHPLKETKVQLRLRAAQKEVIAQAAQVKQTTLTSFMVEHALSAAQQVLADQVHFEISPQRWEAFCAALDMPPKEIPALHKLLTEKTAFDGN
jgi:uncharacterized protein (DUF1778 family)